MSWMLIIYNFWRKVNFLIFDGKNFKLLWFKYKIFKFDSCWNFDGIKVNWLWFNVKIWRFLSEISFIGGIIIWLLFNNKVFILISFFKELGRMVRLWWLRFRIFYLEFIVFNNSLFMFFWVVWYIYFS